MNRSRILLVAAVLLLPSLAPAETIYVAADVATDLDGPATFLPWDVIEHASGGPAFYSLALTLAGSPAIDALHKMDTPGQWLFSVEAPSDLGGVLEVAPEDVVLSSAGTPSLFFDGSCLADAVPAGVGVDAVYLDGGDGGDLIVSFDTPATIGGTVFLSSALVRYERVLSGVCGWSLVGQEIDFRAPPTTSYFPGSVNVIGADRVAGKWIVSLDIPADLAPSTGPTTYLPGQIASFDGAAWDLFEDLPLEGSPGWPVTSQVTALSCQANPGRIQTVVTQITLDKSGSQIEIQCPASCSDGAELYGVYEGKIATVRGGSYDHIQIGCSELCPGTITLTPISSDSYYLVVPHNTKEEGSYGTRRIASVIDERPQAATTTDRCVPDQNLIACP